MRPGFSVITFLAVAVIFLFFNACSLKYENSISVENSVPEMIAENASFYRTEDGKKTLQIEASKLEQYKSGNSTYAKDISFKTFDKDGKTSTEGKSTYISADSEKEEYILLDDIQVRDAQHGINIFAESLHWNGKTEQLTSGKDEEVTLEKDNLKLSGKDFAASTISRSFSFGKNVSGIVETSEEETDAGENDEK